MNGYVVKRGKRTVYINAKSVNAGEKARTLISSISFNRLYNCAKVVPLFDKNTRAIYIN